MSKATPQVPVSEETSPSDFMLTVMGRAVMSLDSHLIRVNPSFCKMLGYCEEELLGKTFADITHPDDIAPGRKLVKRMLAGEIDSFRQEKRYLHKDGHAVWALLSATLVRDADDKPLRCLAQIQDISELKRTEKALEEKTAQLQSITDAMMGYLETGDLRQAVGSILDEALRQTQSEYGFVAVVAKGPDLRILDHKGFKWDKVVNRDIYDSAHRELKKRGYIPFAKMDNLAGRVATHGEVVLSNAPAKHPKATGVPAGHPPLNSFLGVPAVKGGDVVGMIGVANRPGGYQSGDQRKIAVLTNALGLLFDNYRRMEREAALEGQRKRAEAELKESYELLEARVEKRTAQLSKANQALKEQVEERRRVEAKLRESEARFRSAFEHATIGMSVVTPEFRFQRVNRALCDMLGYSAEELTRKSFQDVTHPDDLDIGRDQTQRALEGEFDSFRLEKRYIHKEGHVRWAYVAASVVRDRDGQPLYLVAQQRDITERRKAEAELRTSHEELRRLSRHLVSAREEERKQIAREIHDELGQALTALKLDLSWMEEELAEDQEALSAHTRGMTNLVDETIRSVRGILTALRPAVLDDLGLAAAVEWQAQEFQERTKIDCQLDCSAHEIELDQARATAVFRIFQEALTNVARHAEATQVEVKLGEAGGNLVLNVRDNGKGIEAGQSGGTHTFGILGMRERALLLGGQVEIAGQAGAGTTVSLRVPLEAGVRQQAK
ncbi:MAG TPA: PAS domain S-box protein [Acidobacteriota bacterium]|nr:PAS domain S-box protein [Acidobacteriota bacterium]